MVGQMALTQIALQMLFISMLHVTELLRQRLHPLPLLSVLNLREIRPVLRNLEVRNQALMAS